mgnify:CR=1 FL=1
MPLTTHFLKTLTRVFIACCAAAVLSGAPTHAETMDAEDFTQFDPAQARLGRLLFYDKILSGNMNISCATCHHHSLHGADGVSLGIGEGGYGLGPDRLSGLVGTTRVKARIPRNAPAKAGAAVEEWAAWLSPVAAVAASALKAAETGAHTTSAARHCQVTAHLSQMQVSGYGPACYCATVARLTCSAPASLAPSSTLTNKSAGTFLSTCSTTGRARSRSSCSSSTEPAHKVV